MAWATKITSSEQVEYRLEGACGCDAEHLEQDRQAAIDAQVEYRLRDDLRWIGSGLGDVGLVAGEAVDKAAARALMDGRHPSELAEGGRRLKRLIEPKMAVAPAARVPAAPFVAAILQVAEAAGVEPGEVFRHATAAARFARLERGLLRDGDRHTVPIGDLEQLAAAARLDVAGVVVPPLEAIYEPVLLAEARDHRDDRVRVDARGHDVVLNLPKSVSALYAVVDPVTAAAIEAEYLAAVGETITALEGWASYGVTGHHGDGRTAARIESSGFIGWSMLHRSARPVEGRVGDPHLHAHAVLAHMVRCADGEWRVPGSGGRDIYRHVAASGELVKARVRARLTERFGVAWELDPDNGEWEIVGIPAELRAEFSSRAEQIVGAAGGASAAQQRVAAAKLAESRPEVEPADVRTQWHATAQSVVGDVEAMVAAAMPGPGPGSSSSTRPGGPGRGPAPGYGPHSPAPAGPGPDGAMAAGPVAVPAIADLAAAVWTGPHALTAHTKAVTRVQILTAVAAACPGGVRDVAQLEALTDAVIAAGPTIAVDQLHASHHSNTARWTTRDIVDAEHTITTTAAARMNTAAAAVDPVVAVATVSTWSAQRALTLSPEQLTALERLTTGGHGIDAVIGVAGAGKTTLMAGARTVWENAGYTVRGASTAAVASAGLAAEAGITSRTIASWLLELQDPARPGLAGVDILVVDEGAMVDDRALAALITAAHPSPANPAGTKIVLIGDHLQLRAIGVGGGFKAVHDITAGATLSQNWRQRDPMERAALEVWREGARRTALDQLAGAGRIHAVELPEQVHTEMLTAWQEARTRWAGDPHGELAGLVMLAARNDDVETLNAGARAIRVGAGELEAGTTYRRSAAAGGGSITLAAGDLVRVRANDYRSRTSTDPDILNGFRAVVLQVDADRRVQIQWREPGGDGQLAAPVWIRAEQIVAGHLSHGYAMTIASSQGLTSDLALASGVGADAHSLYPAITRARESTHLWLARTAVEDPADDAVHGPATDDDRLARTVTAYAAAIEKDGPDTLISELLSHDQTAGHVRDVLAQARQDAADRRGEVEVPDLDNLAAGERRPVELPREVPSRQAAEQEVQDWRQRPYGAVATQHLDARITAAEQRAAQAAAEAARIEERLQSEPAELRLARAGQRLQAADIADVGSQMHAQRAYDLQQQISQRGADIYHDSLAADIAQAKASRFLGDPLGRHARTAAELTAQIEARIQDVRTLEDQRDRARDEARNLAVAAQRTRTEAGASHGREPTDVTLNHLTRSYAAADRSSLQRVADLRQEASQQTAAAVGLKAESALRTGISPARLGIENDARTHAAVAQLAARAAAQEAATRAARAADYHPTARPSRGPSLGR